MLQSITASLLRLRPKKHGKPDSVSLAIFTKVKTRRDVMKIDEKSKKGNSRKGVETRN